MKKEIGGEFHLSWLDLFGRNLNQYQNFLVKDKKHFFTSSGRDSLKLIIKILKLSKEDEVLLPSYLCKDILKPFKKEHINIKFYKVNPNLIVDLEDIKKKITGRTKALLIIHYFGFLQPNQQELREICDKSSLYLIEDNVQALLTKKRLEDYSDFSFNSYRKFLAIPDGSLLLSKKDFDKNWGETSLKHFFYIYLRYLATNFKSLYLKINLPPKFSFLRILKYSDSLLDGYPKPAKMSCLSKKILAKINFEQIIRKRRENFRYLLANLKNIRFIRPLFFELPDNVCPLGFPILVRDRELLKKKLIEKRIYPPIHWELSEDINKEEFQASWKFSQNILTIPIDQRYGKKEMDYIIKKIKSICQNW